MLRFFVLFAFLFSLFAPCETQAQKVFYSRAVSFNFQNNEMNVVGKVNGTLFTFRSYGKEYFLEAYDEVMNKTATIVLDFFPEKIYKVRFVPFPNQMLVLYQEQYGTRITQYAAMLNDKGLLQGRVLKIDSRRSSFFGTGDKEFFESAVSDNKNELIVYSAITHNKKLDFTAYRIDLAQMKVAQKIKLNYKGGDIVAVSDGLINNEGDFFLPIYTQIGSRNFADEYDILTLRRNEKLFRKTSLTIRDNYLEYPFEKMDNEHNQIHFASFFATKKNGNNEGVTTATFDMQSLQFVFTKFFPFSEELRAETGARRKDRALNEFRINHLLVKNDGGFLIAAEEYYITTQSNYMPGVGFYSFYYSPMVAQTIREYHFNDILLMSYNASGEQDWYRFMQKNQYSQEDGGLFSSYNMMNTGGDLGFIFNDFNTRRSRIQLVSVGVDGAMQNGYLDAGNANDPDWLPRLGKQVDKREVVVPCLRKKELSFVKIVF